MWSADSGASPEAHPQQLAQKKIKLGDGAELEKLTAEAKVEVDSGIGQGSARVCDPKPSRTPKGPRAEWPTSPAI